jgi:hypothetical protein
MIPANTLCRIVRLPGVWAWLNNRIVTVTGFAGVYYQIEPPIRVVRHGFVGAVTGVIEAHLQPISDPDNCTITDADVYARQPEIINGP